mgnify:CR=1 FL=1
MDSLTTTAQIQALLQTAFKEHQQEKLQSALEKYEQILNVNPNHPDALHLAGLIYLSNNQNNKAEEHIKKSTQIVSNNTDYWNNLGICYYNQKKYKQAIDAYRSCIRLNKNHFQAYNNIGNTYRELKDYPNAIKAFKSALSIQPNYPEAENNLANTLKDIGKTKSAIKHYKKSLELNPNFFDANINIGLALNEIGNYKESISYLEKCIALNSNKKEPLYLAARSYFEIEDYDTALNRINNAIKLDNENSNYFSTKGTILTRSKLWDEAILAFSKAIKIRPGCDKTWINLGSAYKGAQKFIEAEKAYKNALEINPDNYTSLNDLAVIQLNLNKQGEAICNARKSIELNTKNHTLKNKLCKSRTYHTLGLAYLHLEDIQSARKAFIKASEIDKDYIEPLLSSAEIDLLNGNIEKWWQGYEARINKPDNNDRYKILSELKTFDLDKSPVNTQVVILPEQGIGDEIMFASLIPELTNKFSGEIILACDERLVDIFQRSFNTIKVSKINGLHITSSYQKIFIGSIAKYFRKSESDFTPSDAYLFPLKQKKQHFFEKYNKIKGLKIGISWKSGNTAEGKKRTIELKKWKGILNTPGCHLFNLQYGDTKQEISDINSKITSKIISDDEVNPLIDMENFIALASTMDLIITIDNSTAHIGGALGIPTWVMLPYESEWRWLKNRNDSIWYKSIKLFRATNNFGWNDTINNVQKSLGKKVLINH